MCTAINLDKNVRLFTQRENIANASHVLFVKQSVRLLLLIERKPLLK